MMKRRAWGAMKGPAGSGSLKSRIVSLLVPFICIVMHKLIQHIPLIIEEYQKLVGFIVWQGQTCTGSVKNKSSLLILFSTVFA